MKPILLRYLACPQCGSELSCQHTEQKPVELSADELQILQKRGIDPAGYRQEIITGRLSCAKCNVAFPIHEGVPRVYKDAEKDFPATATVSTEAVDQIKDDKHVQASFSRQWNEFEYDEKTIWHWDLEDRIATFCEEINIARPEELRGKLMVDAGCGPGICSMTLSHRHGVEVIGIDLSFVLSRAFRQNKSNLCHFIQGSVLAPPLRPAIADITYSHGVLHHTSSTKNAFDAVEKLTRPGGMLYVWLYGRKRGWNRFRYIFIRAIRTVNSRLPPFPQKLVIYLMTGFHLVIRTFKKLIGMDVAPIESLNQFYYVMRDHYTPKYAREHTEAEVKGWFAEKGYTNVARRTQWTTMKNWDRSTDLAIHGFRPSSASR